MIDEIILKDTEIAKIVADAILDAVKKHVPKRVGDKFNNECYWCPGCGKAIKRMIEERVKIYYCPFCGQALDWTEETS